MKTTKEKQSESKIKKLTDRISLLVEQNHGLLQSMQKFTHFRAKSFFSGRTIKIMENALFSDMFCYHDSVLDDVPINILSSDDFMLSTLIKLNSGTFSDIFSVRSLSTKDLIIFKQYTCDDDSDGLRKISVASQEYRILTLVGPHPNIATAIGLCFSNEVCYFAMSYLGNVIDGITGFIKTRAEFDV